MNMNSLKSSSNSNNNSSNSNNNTFLSHLSSLASLRTEHSKLLERYPDNDQVSDEFSAEVKQLVEAGKTLGASLYSYEDRRSAQTILDFWANVLSRAEIEPPNSTLADLQIHDLDESQYPYGNLVEVFAEADITRLREEIEKRANEIGLKFEEGLVDALFKRLVDKPNPLPLLEFTLWKLWNDKDRNWITWEAYKNLGGNPQKVLLKSADIFYEEKSPEERKAIESILLKMVGSEPDSEPIQGTPYKTLCQEQQDSNCTNVLNELIDKRLLRKILGSTPDDDESQIKPIHGILINDWLKLVQARAVEQRKQRLLLAAPSLALQAESQKRHGQDERAALLARQAYLFSQRFPSQIPDDIYEEVLREVLNTPYIRHILNFEQPVSQISGVVFCSDGTGNVFLACGTYSGSVKLWDIKIDQPPTFLRTLTLPNIGCRVTSVAFDCKEQKLAAGCDDGNVYLWNMSELDTPTLISCDHPSAPYPIRDGEELYSDWVTSLAFHPDGQILAWGSRSDKMYLHYLDKTNDDTITLPLNASKPDPQATNPKHWFKSVAFSQDGKILAAGRRDGSLWLWNLKTSQSTPTVLDVLSVYDEDNKDWRSLGEKDRWQQEIFSVAFSHNSEYLATGGRDGIHLWSLIRHDKNSEIKIEKKDIIPNRSESNTRGHRNPVSALAFSPKDETLASGSLGSTIRLWNLKNLNDQPKVLVGNYGGVSSLAFGFKGEIEILASGWWGKHLVLWKKMNLIKESSSDRLLPIEPFHVLREVGKVFSVAFSPDNSNEKILAISCDNGTVKLYNQNNQNSWAKRSELKIPENEAEGYARTIKAILFHPEEAGRLITGGYDGKIRVWNLDELKVISKIDGHEGERITSIALSPNSKILASASYDKTVRLWELDFQKKNIKLIRTSIDHQSRIFSIAFSPLENKPILASGSENGKIRLWKNWEGIDREPTTILSTDDREKEIRALAFSYDAKFLASASSDGSVRLWNLQDIDWNLQQLDQQHPIILRSSGGPGFSSVVFSPDGQKLIAGSWDNNVYLWSVRQVLNEPDPTPTQGYHMTVSSVAFSPDSKLIVSGGHDNTVRIWMSSAKALADDVCDNVWWCNLTMEDWNKFVGNDIPYERTCGVYSSGKGAPKDAPDAAEQAFKS